MITLAILQKLAEDNVAGLVVDENCYWEQAPLTKDGQPAKGVWLVTRSGDMTRSKKGLNLHSTVDFYVAYNNKMKTEQIHQEILEWIIANPTVCKLSGSVGSISYDFTNIRIRPTRTPDNVMVTLNGLVVKVASAELVYDIN